jgi:flagellar biosynthesis/type III secretory pathway M-ring protein FliF/YscJ
MEKNGKEPETFKHHSSYFANALLLVLCVVVVVQFAVIARNVVSLKALNNKVNALEEEKDFKSLENENDEHRTTRSKRGTENTDFKKALIKLEKLEGR